jgi:hypothetical protein
MARGKGRYTPPLNQARVGFRKQGDTAARNVVGKFKSQ